MSDTLFCSICRHPYKDCSCPAKGLASALQALDALQAPKAPQTSSWEERNVEMMHSQCPDCGNDIRYRPCTCETPMRYEVQLTRQPSKKFNNVIEALEEVNRLLKDGEDTIFIYDHVKECPVLAIDFQSGLPEMMAKP